MLEAIKQAAHGLRITALGSTSYRACDATHYMASWKPCASMQRPVGTF